MAVANASAAGAQANEREPADAEAPRFRPAPSLADADDPARLHAEALVLDLHNDGLWQMISRGRHFAAGAVPAVPPRHARDSHGNAFVVRIAHAVAGRTGPR